MIKIERRSMIKSLGAISLGIAAPSLLKGEVLVKTHEVKKQIIKTDILVVGGGTAGVIAAIQAGRAGSKTILVENGSQLGGTTTTGGVSFPGIFFAWGKQVIGGIGWEIVQECVSSNNDTLPDFSIPHGKQHWKHQVRVNELLYTLMAEEKCLEAGVKIRYYETPIKIEFQNSNWVVETVGKGTQTQIVCNQLIDCTGNAFATSMAGYNVLRESATQPGTLMFKLGGYNFSTLDIELIKERYEEELKKGDLVKAEFLSITGLLRSKGDNVQHIIGADSTTSDIHTITNIKGRMSLLKILRFLRTLPGCEKTTLVDMQTETAIRETFRIDGLYKITQLDYVTGKVFEDSISYSYYPIDLHDKNGVIPNHLSENVVATVPLRALIPRNSVNFIVAGRSVSSDRLANSALRVQASCMGMGQAAAAAAVLANRLNKSPAEVPLKKIKQLIKEHGGIIPE